MILIMIFFSFFNNSIVKIKRNLNHIFFIKIVIIKVSKTISRLNCGFTKKLRPYHYYEDFTRVCEAIVIDAFLALTIQNAN